MSGRPELLARKTVTVLFCDVVGSTSLGERVDPETTRRVMLRYFDETRTVLERHGGTVEKFIGDAVMAVFGIPVLHEDDALRAVRAAGELREALERLNEELERRYRVQLAVRVGINTGEVVVGDPSTGQTIATGDTVNVAARLQQAAQPGQILLGRETYRLVRDRVEAGPLQSFSLRGRDESVAPWELKQVHERVAGMLRRIDSPFVGRRDAREVLERTYARTVEESACRLVTVLGAPGLGKTRLAQEFASRLLAAYVLQGRCLPYGEGITFWPITEIVRDAASISSDDSAAEARARVARLLPPADESSLVCERVCETIGLGEHAPRTEESFWALRRLFETIAAARPLVLVLEDLHWAEPTLLDLLEYLVGWSAGAPILLLGLARPELAETRPSFVSEAVLLEPLDSEEIGLLAASTLGSAPLDPALVDRVVESADGNPLFAQELVRMLLDEGLLARDGGVWTATRDLGELTIPSSISALLAARLDRLEPDEREVIQCASVVGKEFWWGAVADLARRSDVATPLHALVRKRLIVPAGSATVVGEDAFRFDHILVRDAAYAALPKSTRSELHEQHAEWLLRKLGERATEVEEIVGYHLEQAHRLRAELGPVDEPGRELATRASAHLAAGGRRALERGDMHAASSLLRRASSLAPDEQSVAELAPDLGAALMESGELAEADALLTRASEFTDPGLAARARVVRCHVRFRTDATGALEETRNVAESAIATFTELGDERGLAYALRLLSLTHSWHCEWQAMAEALERALHHAEKAADRRERSSILTWLNVALYYGPAAVADAIRRCESVLAESAGDPVVEGHTSCVLSGLLAMTARFEEARAHASRGITALEALGLRIRLGHARIFVADAELLAGQPLAAEQELLTAYETLERIGDRAGSLVAAYDLAGVLYNQGRYDDAEQWAALGRDVLERSDVMMRVTGLAIDARLAARAGRNGEAEALVRRALELADRTDALNMRATTWSALADVLRLAGRSDDAEAALQNAVGLYEAKGNVAGAARVRALLASAPA